MSAAVAAALKKIAAFILSDKELRGKAIVVIGSIIAGFLGLMCLPAVVLVSLGNMEFEPPEIDKSLFDEAAFIENLSNEQQAQLANLKNQGQAIENAMVNADCKNQTIYLTSKRTLLFPECLNKPWQTGTSKKTTRLMQDLNLSWTELTGNPITGGAD